MSVYSTGIGTSKLLPRDGTRPMTGDLDMGTHKITSLVDPTSNQHAATKKYVDDNVGVTDHGALTGLADDDHTQYYNATRHTKAVHDALGLDHGSLSGKGDYDHDQYLRKNGAQAMTGDLNLNSNALRNASEIEFSSDYAFTPLNGFLELVNKANSSFQDLRVGILDIQTALDMNQNTLADLPTPSLSHEAATKGYVDNNIPAAFSCSDLSSCSLANLGTRSAGDLSSGTLALARFTKGTDGHVLKGNGFDAFDSPSYADPNGLIDHGSIGGLGDDDHTQYLLVNGNRAMTGDLTLSGTREVKTTGGDLGLNSVNYIWALKPLIPNTDNSRILGASNYRWSALYAVLAYLYGDLTLSGDRIVKATGKLTLNCGAADYLWALSGFLPSATDTHGLGNTAYRWSDLWAVVVHEGDVAFAEKECIKCDKKFKVGDNIVYKVIRFDEETEEPMAIPIHLECANSPPKKVKKSYAVQEDYYEWDEEKGEAVKRKRNKAVTKKVKKRKIKEGFELDDKKGEFRKLEKEGKAETMLIDKKVRVEDATEEIEEETSETIYEEKEFLI